MSKFLLAFGNLFNIIPIIERPVIKKYTSYQYVNRSSIRHQVQDGLRSHWMKVGSYIEHGIDIERVRARNDA